MERMFRACRSALSPIPECSRMAGVPTDPAERMISLSAKTSLSGAVCGC